jgi:ribonuclease HI
MRDLGTNNTAELNALHHALLMAETTIVAGQTAQILCDSTYAINCISKWAARWQEKGWRKAGGEIKNLSPYPVSFRDRHMARCANERQDACAQIL